MKMNFQIPQFLSTYMYKNKGVPLEKAYILATPLGSGPKTYSWGQAPRLSLKGQV